MAAKSGILNLLGMMVMRALGNRLLAAAALCSLTSGCCTSLRRAKEINAELREQNIARTEPAMHSAAQHQAATLLKDRPQGLWFTPLCDGTPDSTLRAHHYCVIQSEPVISVTGGLGDVYQLLDQEGKRRIAITIGEELRGARLAKRGNTLFLLKPALTFHQVDRRTQCQCEGGPVLVSMSGFVDLGLAFVLDDQPRAEIQTISVPVVDDYVAWDCKLFLVRNDHVPQPAVADGSAHPHAPVRSQPRRSASIGSFFCLP